MMIPDGTLIVAETFATPLTGPSASCPTDRWPTGAPGALDAEGHVGSQRAGAAVCHLAPGGRIDDQVAMPEGARRLRVWARRQGRTLIACAAQDFHEQARAAAREAVLLTTTRPRQAERSPAAGNPSPCLSLRAPAGSIGRLLQLAEPPHPRRVTPRGGKQQRIRDDLAVRSPYSGREILRAIGVDQHLRTSAPRRTVRLPRHVPDLPTGELPLKVASALTVPHGLSPPSTLSNTQSPGHEYPDRQTRCGSFRPRQSTTPRQPQLTGACSREPTGTPHALRRAAPEASDLFSGTGASPAPSRPWSGTG